MQKTRGEATNAASKGLEADGSCVCFMIEWIYLSEYGRFYLLLELFAMTISRRSDSREVARAAT